MKLEVGQKLYLRHRFGLNRTVEVTKVGRKWATLHDGRRIDVTTLREERGYGQCFPSIQAYEDEKRLHETWRALCVSLRDRYRTPDGMTIERIQQAAELLGITIGDTP